MNTHEPLDCMNCDRMALILPLLDDGELDPPTRAAALNHLRTCEHCQRERQRYTALDQALRERFGLSSVRPHTTETIMQHITNRSQSPEPDAPIPVPNGPRRFNHISRPWLSGLGAVAVVTVLLGTAALLFGGRLGFGPGAHGGPPRYTFPGTQGVFADVSMVSPTEGWALAQVTKTPDGKSASNTVTFYHYLNGAWTPVTVTLSAQATNALQTGGAAGFNGAISMDSATDGWAVASSFNRGSVLFHYTGGKWQEVKDAPSQTLGDIQALSPDSVWAYSGGLYAISGQPASLVHYDGKTWTKQTINGMTEPSRLVSLQMVSDSLGWAVFSPTGDFGKPDYIVAHYTGNNTWTTHSTINAGDLGAINGLAMVSPDEGWAFGDHPINGPSSITAGKPVPQALYHYSNGKWQTAPLNLNERVSFLTLEKIVMRSASDGWIIAQDQNQRPGITASGIQKRTILLHYDGNAWKQVETPETGGDASIITDMSFTGDTGWACGYIAALPDGKTIQDSDVPSYGSPMLWKYADGTWTLYQQK